MTSCIENFGNNVEGFISNVFLKLGTFVANKPKRTIAFCIIITAICGAGFMNFETENRSDKLWVPQNTRAEAETNDYQKYFGSTIRFNSIIVQSAESGGNVVTKDHLVDAMKMHEKIETFVAKAEWTPTGAKETNTTEHNYLDLCAAGASCLTQSDDPICGCAILGILQLWDYDLAKLQEDDDVLATVNGNYPRTEDLEAAFGKPVIEGGSLVSAEAFRVSYLVKDQSDKVGSAESGSMADPISEAWEKQAFIDTATSVPKEFPTLSVDYLAGRSFGDEFGGAISGDLMLVQISYLVVFLFLGANMGKFLPGPESRWTMALAALVLVILSTAASFGLSAGIGLFFGPVHSLLPFILLGIGVDDAFVIVNAFNRERTVPRSQESNTDLAKRSANALARAGASITVTSLTDLVAFGISASSSLPALASFCGYAAIGIVFLWVFASTFFTACMVFDERRQRDNRRECLCCLTRKKEVEKDEIFEEGGISRYFRNYHAPWILSKIGKPVVLLVFSGLLAFGIWGTLNLSVEDTQRAFIPSDSYLTSFINANDALYPSSGIDVFFVFEDSSEIYEKRDALANLKSRLEGKSTEAPFIAEPVSDDAYRNVMSGLKEDLEKNGDDYNVQLVDSWPTNEEDFIKVLGKYASYIGNGRAYAADVKFADKERTQLESIRVESSYVSLTKPKGDDKIDDADRQVDAMDETRTMVDSWADELPPVFTYSEKFLSIEGFKIIKKELFLNVGLALAAVAVIVFFTVASPVTSILITLNVAACVIEILGFMHAIGIAIDSVSVINIVLAVGLSIDYSAHVGHCFMLKGGDDRNNRALEALADIGAAVLSGAMSTFLAVVVLLFSKSYVFSILSKQFALTVGLGVLHGLVLLPVLLSLLGPKAFDAADKGKNVESDENDLELHVE
jgi:Niemann-Pick C1 protein